jgi:hypothetical protein
MEKELLARVQRLERMNRQLLVGLVGVGLALGLVVVAGAARQQDDTVTASTLLLKDKENRTRIILSAEEDKAGPGLTILDEVKQPRISLRLYRPSGMPIFKMFDATGLERIKAIVSPGGSPGFYLKDEKGRPLEAVR